MAPLEAVIPQARDDMSEAGEFVLVAPKARVAPGLTKRITLTGLSTPGDILT
jgi:hypothetical protein